MPVGSIAEVITGRTPPTDEGRFWGGSIPFITPGDLKGSFIREAERTITEEGLKVSRGLPRDTVLVSCIGYIGKVGIVDSPVAVTNQQINAVVPRQTEADSQFLAYAFMHLEPYLSNLAGVTTIPILNKSSFEAALVPLPPLPEQRAIARVLRAVQAAREARQREVSLERERKAALMAHLFTHGTRGEPTKQTPIGEMPVSWEVVRLGEVCVFTTGKLNSEASVDGGEYHFFTCSPDTLRIDSFSFDQEAILLAGNNAQAIYSVKYYAGKFDAYQRTYVITIYASDRMTYRYLLYEMSLSLESLRRQSLGATTRYLTASIISGLPLRQPPIEEQKRIADVLTACDAEITALERESALLDELFRALLEELMTGRVSVARVGETNG